MRAEVPADSRLAKAACIDAIIREIEIAAVLSPVFFDHVIENGPREVFAVVRRAEAQIRGGSLGQIGLAVARPPAPCPLHGEDKTYRDTNRAQPVAGGSEE